MPEFVLPSYELSGYEKLIFIAAPAYSERHRQQASEAVTWQARKWHSALAEIESVPLLGALIALIELAVAMVWQSFHSQPKPALSTVIVKENPVVELAEVLPPTPVAQTAHAAIETLPNYIVEETKMILTTLGFEKEASDHKTEHGYKGEIQGTHALRMAAAKATKDDPMAISPAALKAQREVNLEQYLILKLKRFAHAHDLKGHLTLPSGKTFNLEGFCEAFTVPMITSSFQIFAKENAFFTPDEANWIAKQLNQTTSSDYTEPDDIQAFALMIQDPKFVGPIALGTGHHWHSTGSVFFGPYLIYCDQGGAVKPGIHVYEIPDSSLVSDGVLWEMTKRQEVFKGDVFGSKRIEKDLKGKLIHYEALPAQKVGNCTYMSMLCVLFVMMVIKRIMNFTKIEGQELDPAIHASIWSEVFGLVKPIFEELVAFDRKLVLDDLVDEIDEWLHQKGSFSEHPLDDLYRSIFQIWYKQEKSLGTEKLFSAKIQALADVFGIVAI